MSAKSFQPAYIDLPYERVKDSPGISMDFGGSLLKVIYRPKDKSAGEDEPAVPAGFLRYRLAVYNRDDLDKALADISQYSDITRHDNSTTAINATGVGANKYARTISETLNLRINNLPETDCFTEAFCCIVKQLSKSQAVDPHHEKGLSEGEKINKARTESLLQARRKGLIGDSFLINEEVIKEGDVDQDKPIAETHPDLFPCLIATMGSAFGLLKVNQDGTTEIGGVSTRGGRTLFGLGSLLTGAESFEELIELAENGNHAAVNNMTNDFKMDEAKKGKDVYNIVSDFENMTYNFGKAVGKTTGDFSREDLARASVVYTVVDFVHTAQLTAMAKGLSGIFMCGSFTNSNVVRHEVSKYIKLRETAGITTFHKPTHFYFMKHGSHFGAIGALLKEVKETTV